MEDNKLYYEKVNISRVPEVEEAYKYVVKNNYKYYRAITEKGAFFGWVNGKCTKAVDGQEWFENLEYKEPESEITPDISLNKSGLVEAVEPVKEPIETVQGVDYESLYKETCELLKQTQDLAANNLKAYLAVKEELDSIRNAFALIVKEYEIAKHIEE